MALAAGTRLGPYAIVAPLGAGGMGEVYRAKDTRLGRDVAIKVLPSHLSASTEVRARFEREARAVSSLNHPHICTLHDVGREGDTDYLVMELVDGETLAERLARGALPLADVLRIGGQIADALNRAHRAGVVHRDLKPGNVMLTKSGAKLLDFGLAKSASDGAGIVDGSTGLATEAKPLTREGTILGTFQYMAPEQFEGVDADARTDIFALGLVLYEMVTGRRAFEGKTRTSLIAAIVSSEPRPLREVDPLSPAALEHVIRKCLEKDPENRWHSAYDVAAELRWIAEGGSQALAAPKQRGRESAAWAVAVLAIVAALVLGFRQWRGVATPAAVRASLMAPPSAEFQLGDFHTGSLAASPDGRSIVVAIKGDGDALPALWLRPIGSSAATKIPGTDGGAYPFWSPDGKFMAFSTADGKLKKVDLTGAPPVVICEARRVRGGTWNRDGTIVLALASTSGLHSVSAGGGPLKPVTRLDSKGGETTHRYPWFLPDGKHFLFFAGSHAAVDRAGDTGAIWLGTLDSSERKKLFPSSSQAELAGGFIFFVRDGVLLAQRFDDRELTIAGDPIPLAEGVSLDRSFFRSIFSVSEGGILVYRRGEAQEMRHLEVYDRGGTRVFRSPQPDLYVRYHLVSISPDGRRLLFNIEDPETGVASLWSMDMERGIRARVTFGNASDSVPIWAPDGKRLAFARTEEGGFWKVMVKDLESAAEERVVWSEEKRTGWPTGWSPDGRVLACTAQDEKGARDVVMVPLDGGKPVSLLASPSYNEYNPVFSPDGRWISYISNESGKSEVYAVSWPEGKGKQQISNGDLGDVPVAFWHEDGIAYLGNGNTVTATAVRRVGGRLEIGAPRALFKIADARTFTVSPDGSLFSTVVPVERAEERARRGLDLIVNWQELIRVSAAGGK